MNIAQLIQDAAKAGVFLKAQQGALHFELTVDEFPPVLKQQIIDNKQAIIDYLAGVDQQVVTELRPKIEADAQRGNMVPMSFAQQRLWFIERFESGTTAYNMPAAWQVDGAFSVAAAEAALARIVARHEVLRTRFIEQAGQPMQEVVPEMVIRLQREDVSMLSGEAQQASIEQLLASHSRHQFDLATGPLLHGVYVYQGGEGAQQRGVLLFNMHHIVSDGWSMGVLVQEFIHHYQASLAQRDSDMAALPLQYADYAQWQRHWLTGDVLQQQLDYWQEQLSELPPVHSLPLDFPREDDNGHEGGLITGQLSPQLSDRLQELAKAQGVTDFMLLHALVAVLLSRHSNSHDIVLGTAVANRMQAELAPLIGFFVNTLVLRTDTRADTLAEFLVHVKDVNLKAQAHQDVPFEQLVEHCGVARSRQHAPLCQIMFSMNTTQSDRLSLPDVTLSALLGQQITAKFELEINADFTEAGLQLHWVYNTRLFNAAHIEQLNAHLIRLLEAVARFGVNTPMAALPMLSDAEQQYLLHTLNNTTSTAELGGYDHFADTLIHECFEQHVEAHPDNIAVIYGDTQLTYRQLNHRANQLARYLRDDLNVQPESLVGICVDRSSDMVTALLAVLKAGAAYVPLDPAYPTERFRFIFDDTQLSVVLTQGEARRALVGFSGRVVEMNVDAISANDTGVQQPTSSACLSDYSVANLGRSTQCTGANQLAYLIYTSGSTGQPKGVMIEHHSVCNLVAAQLHNYDIVPNSNEVGLLLANYTFDAAVEQIFVMLLSANTLVIPPQSALLAPDVLSALITDHQVTHVDSTPSHLMTIVSCLNHDSVKRVVSGGEAMVAALLNAVNPSIDLFNVYGPTEACVTASVALRNSTIGKPIQHTQFYLLDRDLNPVPMGSTGELFIGGEGVARGYLNREEQTATAFIANPFVTQTPSASTRLYRTGDLARYLPDGQVQFLGRLDDQVKIRGFRVELGEIAQCLHQLAGVDSSLVEVFTKGDVQQLVAYVQPTSSQLQTHSHTETHGQDWLKELQRTLRQQLPEYMVPTAFVIVEQWPLTANGKLDKARLPSAHTAGVLEQYAAPKNEIESVLVEIWAELLHLESPALSATSHFFALGGHSLLAVKMVSAIRDKFACELSIKHIFEAGDIRGLATKISAAEQCTTRSLIPALSRDGELMPLSFSQQRLWFIDQFEGGTAAYNMPAAWAITGNFSVAAAQEALERIVARHEVLRTRFVDLDGQVVQQIMPTMPIPLLREDVSDLFGDEQQARIQQLLTAHSDYRFDLTQGPLLRIVYVYQGGKGDAQRGVLMFNMHHIVSDGWSVSIMVQEFVHHYQASLAGRTSELAPLPVQYADYAQWQRNWLVGEVLDQQLTYWQQQLDGVPELHSLPTDFARPAEQSYRGAYHSSILDSATLHTLKGITESEGVTLFMLLMAAFNVLIAKHSGEQDIVVGTPVANRTDTNIEPLVGFFTNTLALRTQVSTGLSFVELLQQVKHNSIQALAHQHMPFDMLVEKLQLTRSLSYSPLFQLMFSLQNNLATDVVLPALTLSPLKPSVSVSKFDISVESIETEQGLHINWTYSSDLFGADTIARFATHFISLLQGIAQNPQQNLEHMNVLDVAERQKILTEFNSNTLPYPTDPSLLTRFATVAAQQPDLIAVSHGTEQLTYAELDRRSNQLAYYLLKQNIATETRIGICMTRSSHLIVAMLAVLKTGNAYVPLDPNYPESRINYILKDSQTTLVLCETSSKTALNIAQLRHICIDSEQVASDIAASPTTAPAVSLSDEQLAYVIYTSGSTGKPKGVAIQHRSAVAFAYWATHTYSQAQLAGVLASTSICFDLSIFEIFVPLSVGGRIVLVDNLFGLIDLSDKSRVTLINTVPSAISELINQLDVLPSTVKTVNVAGEALTRTLANRIYQASDIDALYNLYGPSEDTTYSTFAKVPNDNVTSPSIGRTIANTQAYVLDTVGQPTPIGVPGELHLAGKGLAQGYLFKPELTAEKFIPNPFEVANGASLYKTGDLVMWQPDGQLRYLGRLDHQVKVRGFRIELGEILSQLQRLDQVEDATVIVREDEPGHKKLVAYVVPQTTENNPEYSPQFSANIRQELSHYLPDYMVPSFIVLLDQLPLTLNGKVDTRSLPAPEATESNTDIVQAQSADEQLLVAIWANLLKLREDQVSVTANFFEMGGDSILSIQAVSRAAQAGLHFSVKDLFSAQSIRELLRVVKRSARVCVPQHPVTGELSLLPIQRQFFTDSIDTHHYNQALLLHVPEDFSVELLTAMVEKLYQRHDALRLRFYQQNTQWLAEHLPWDAAMLSSAVSEQVWTANDFSTLADAATKVQTSLNLARGEVFKAVYFNGQVSCGESRLLLVIHHLVVDGVSWRVLGEDLARMLAQSRAGEALSLLPKTSSYQQWGEFLQEYAHSDILAQELPYWLSAVKTPVISLQRTAELHAKPDQDFKLDQHKASLQTEVFSLDVQCTEQLLGQAGQAYRTQINELLLTAVCVAIQHWSADTATGENAIRLDLEGHGREALTEQLALSQTVGWFTTLYPLTLRLDSAAHLEQAICDIKEQYRALPNNGIGFGVLKHVKQAVELAQLPNSEMVFNYLGQVAQQDEHPTALRMANESKGQRVSGNRQREHQLVLTGIVADNQLSFELQYDARLYAPQAMQALMQCLHQSLQAVTSHCVATKHGRYTPSDFPLTQVTDEQLLTLQKHYPNMENVYQATPMQHAMLVQRFLDEKGGSYVSQTVINLVGDFDLALFGKALQGLAQLEIFRTAFFDTDGNTTQQIVLDRAEIPFLQFDWSDKAEAQQLVDFERFLKSDKQKGFDIARPPLARLSMLQLSATTYRMVWTSHHALLDGWSMPHVLNTLIDHYESYRKDGVLAATNIVPFSRYIDWLMQQDATKAHAYWQQALAGVTSPTSLSIEKTNRVDGEVNFQLAHKQFSESITAKLLKSAQKHQLTLNTLIQGAWGYLLHRYSGERSVVFGATVSGRPAHLQGIESMVGMFINSLPVRVDIPESGLLVDWLKVLHSTSIARDEFSFSPLIDIQRLSEFAPGVQLFNSLVVVENFPMGEVAQTLEDKTGLKISNEQSELYYQFPLTLTVIPGQKLTLSLAHDTHRFDTADVERLLEQLATILSAMAESLTQHINALPLLSDAEQQLLIVGRNDTTEQWRSADSLLQQFANQVAQHPEEVAVSMGDIELSYTELAEKSDRLAAYLVEEELTDGERIGIYVDRSPALIIAILGVLKSGCCYVPIHPDNNTDRVSHIVEDADIPLMLLHSDKLEDMSVAGVDLFYLDECLAEDWLEDFSVEDGEGLPCDHAETDTAYIIYTSGSTGKPKGVEILHKGLLDYCNFASSHYYADHVDASLVVTSHGFDIAVPSLFVPLLNGDEVQLFDQDIGFEQLSNVLKDSGKNYLLRMTPSHVRALLLGCDTPQVGQHVFVIGGEAFSTDIAKQLQAIYPYSQIFNHYGPTETVVGCAMYDVSAHRDVLPEQLPIGKPMSNTQLYVLDANMRPQPDGVIGELYIGGDGVAKGYINLPELTAKHFLANPFIADEGARVYRTGDLVRWLPDGNLAFVGRVDNQVKIRGYRIELGDILNSLQRLDVVAEATVVAREDTPGHKRLVAYVVPKKARKSERMLETTLRQQLAQSLPDYMVPAFFVLLEKLPLTANGKIDSKALPALGDAKLSTEVVAAATADEHLLVDIWAGLLKLRTEQVSVTADFFELGGDSILAIQVVSRAAQAGLHFTVKELFSAKSIRELLSVAKHSVQVHAPQEAVQGELAMLPIQTLFFTDDVDTHHYNQSLLLHVPNDLSIGLLSAMVEKLYLRHDALRLAFCKTSNAVSDSTQTLWNATHQPLNEAMIDSATAEQIWTAPDFSGLHDAANAIQQSMDLAKGQLFKAVLFNGQASSGESRLLLVLHHLVVDGVSWRVLIEDMLRMLEQARTHQTLSLPPKTSSYQLWGAFLQEYAHSETLATELPYWQAMANTQVQSLQQATANLEALAQIEGCINDQANSGMGRVSIQLSTERTEQLLTQANQAYRMQINELLLTALSLAIQSWRGVGAIRIDLEGHGREPLSEQLDLSQTVGWFTSVYPLTLNIDATATLEQTLCDVKEQYRTLPNKGIGFGLLKYLKQSPELADTPTSEIVFNYLGQVDQVTDENSALRMATEPRGESVSRNRKSKYGLTLNAMVSNQQFDCELLFDTQDYATVAMQGLLECLSVSIECVIQHCINTKQGCYTPSDFPLARVDAQQLSLWQQSKYPIEDLYPATGMQQGLLLHSMLQAGSYVTQTSLRIENIQLDVFQQAWQLVIQRHAIFRTGFVGLDINNVHQRVLPEVKLPWYELDLTDLSDDEQQARLTALRIADKARDFSPEEAPLMRITVIKLASNTYQILWSRHHALLDGWCTPLVFAEVTQAYLALSKQQTPALPSAPAYRDYAVWLAQQDKGLADKYWHEQLADVEGNTPLPLANPQAVTDVNATVCSEKLEIPVEISEKVVTLAQQSQTTVNIVVQAAWALLLGRYSYREQVVFGAVTSGRPAELAGVENIIGLFINTLPVVTTLNAETDVRTWLQHLHQQQIENDSHNFVPLFDILRANPVGNELFDSLIVFENYPVDEAIDDHSVQAGLNVQAVHSYEQTNYGLTLVVHQGATLHIEFKGQAERFDQVALAQLAAQMQHLLSQLAEPNATVGDIRLQPCVATLTAASMDSATNDNARLIHEQFEQIALNVPTNIALVYQEVSVTYAVLNQRANQLAHYLVSKGVTPNNRVALCLPRSIDMAISMLACWKVGAAYVPISVDFPQDRISFMLSDATPKLLLTVVSFEQRLTVHSTTTVCVDADAVCAQVAANSVENLSASALRITSATPAYVIYTSGTTGTPKGVVVTHENVNHFNAGFTEQLAQLGITQLSAWLWSSSFTFDASVKGLLGLLRGATVVLPTDSQMKDVDALVQLVAEHAIPVINGAPALIELLLNDLSNNALITQKPCLIIGGEKLSSTLWHRVAAYCEQTHTAALNAYGPTETTINATSALIQSMATPTIGTPLRNTLAYVLDKQCNPLPVGAIGELCIGGKGVAQGYLNNPKLTQQRFINITHVNVQSERVYRTGDLVKQRPTGEFEFIGRNDDQVKVRGFRIELADVEKHLQDCAPVQSCKVITRSDDYGNNTLIGYYQSQQDNAQQFIWQQLQSTLPDYMLPSMLVRVEHWPTTVNGKINIAALPEPHTGDRDASYQAAATATQQQLVTIWSTLLNLPESQISITANFFTLGGHSLLLVRMRSMVREQFGIEPALESYFERRNIQSLAEHIDQLKEDQARYLALTTSGDVDSKQADGENTTTVLI